MTRSKNINNNNLPAAKHLSVAGGLEGFLSGKTGSSYGLSGGSSYGLSGGLNGGFAYGLNGRLGLGLSYGLLMRALGIGFVCLDGDWLEGLYMMTIFEL